MSKDELQTLLNASTAENILLNFLVENQQILEEKIKDLEKQIMYSQMKPFLNEQEACEMFQTSTVTLWRLAKNGKLIVYKNGKLNRYKYEDLVQTFSNPQNFYYKR